MFIPVGHLAFQAVVALVVNNLAGGLDGGYLALMSAGLTRFATLIASAKPVKNPEFGHEAEAGAQRAQIFAVKFTVNRR